MQIKCSPQAPGKLPLYPMEVQNFGSSKFIAFSIEVCSIDLLFLWSSGDLMPDSKMYIYVIITALEKSNEEMTKTSEFNYLNLEEIF